MEFQFSISNADFALVRSIFVLPGTLIDDDNDLENDPAYPNANDNYGFSLPLNGGVFTSDSPRATSFSTDPVLGRITVTFNQQVDLIAGGEANFIFNRFTGGTYVPAVGIATEVNNTMIVFQDVAGGASAVPFDLVSLTLRSTAPGAVEQGTSGTDSEDQSIPGNAEDLTYPGGFGTGPLLISSVRTVDRDIFDVPTGVTFINTYDQPLAADAGGQLVTFYGPEPGDANDVTSAPIAAGDTEVTFTVLNTATEFNEIVAATWVGHDNGHPTAQRVGHRAVHRTERVRARRVHHGRA